MHPGTTLRQWNEQATSIFATDRRLPTVLALICMATTVAAIVAANPHSLVGYIWYFVIWSGFILLCHRQELGAFSLAFIANSTFVALFVLIQSAAYPDSYGTTSPFSSSWTDDSYFFTLAADRFEPDLLSRASYWEYSNLFPTLIRLVTPFRIEHPLDALFFQSGTAALLATFASRYMYQLSHDRRLARLVYIFCVFCPFLMMNGGVILLRDSLVAALFVYSLCCIGERRFLLAVIAIAIQTGVRPGTGFLLLPAYLIIYFREVRTFAAKHPLAATASIGACVAAIALLVPVAITFLGTYYDLSTISFLGRDVLAEFRADPDMNVLFLRIQELPFPLRLVLNAAYIFLYPFLSMRFLSEMPQVDIREITLGLIVPVYSFWLNAWFVAGATSFKPLMKRHRAIVISIVITLVLVGIYSLQTRHKTIIYPLYYLIVAIGFARATPVARRFGYVVSSTFLFIELASLLRHL